MSIRISCLLKSIKDSWDSKTIKTLAVSNRVLGSEPRTNVFEKAATVAYASKSSAGEVETGGYLGLNGGVVSSACQAPGQ